MHIYTHICIYVCIDIHVMSIYKDTTYYVGRITYYIYIYLFIILDCALACFMVIGRY